MAKKPTDDSDNTAAPTPEQLAAPVEAAPVAEVPPRKKKGESLLQRNIRLTAARNSK